jgi:type IV secretory pathway TrbD component
MSHLPVTRRVLTYELILNAASRPLNVAVPLGVIAAALVLTPWLIALAALAYAGLVLATFLDGDVAESVGRDVYARSRRALPETRLTALTESAADSLALAHETRRQIQNTIAESHIPLPEVEAEVNALLDELENLAPHVERLTRYLAQEDEAALRLRLERIETSYSGDTEVDRANAEVAAALEQQLHARAQLSRRLSQFEAQMEHIAATLSLVHAQIMKMSAAEEASTQARVAAQLRYLRQDVDTTAAAFDEAYRELDY